MNITLSNIVEHSENRKTLYVESEEDLLRVNKLCEFFNLKVPKMSIIHYIVSFNCLRSDNGKQVLVYKDGCNFFVGGKTKIAKQYHKLRWEQIPNEFKRFAKAIN